MLWAIRLGAADVFQLRQDDDELRPAQARHGIGYAHAS